MDLPPLPNTAVHKSKMRYSRALDTISAEKYRNETKLAGIC